MLPDTRRAARTFERIFAALFSLGLLAWLIALLSDQPEWLGWIAMALLIILGMREFMIGSENVAARFRLKAGKDGIDSEIDSEVVKDGDSVTINKETP